MKSATWKVILAYTVMTSALLTGCVTDSKKHILSTSESQVQLRSDQVVILLVSGRLVVI